MESLKKLNFVHSRIDAIQYDAFNEIPNLDRLTFDTCNITDIAEGAFRLFQTRQLECPVVAENNTISSVSYDMMEYFMNPQVTDVSPFEDPRFMFYRCKITTIQPAAIQTNQFSYIVFKENVIGTFGEEALMDVKLGNNCKERLLLFKSNIIDTLKTDFMAFVRAKLSPAYKTFFIMKNNTFGTVEKRAFRINPGLTIASVDDNKFVCDCNSTEWYINAFYTNLTEEGTRQKELEDKLVSTSHCSSEEESLYVLLSYCLEEHVKDTTSDSTHLSVNYVHFYVIFLAHLQLGQIY